MLFTLIAASAPISHFQTNVHCGPPSIWFLGSLFSIAGTGIASPWGSDIALDDIDQSGPANLDTPTSEIQVPARDLRSIFGHKHRNRSLFLQKVLRQATSQFRDNRPTSSTTKRQMTSQTEKRRSRYKCDFTRVTIQMILEYFRTRRICGYRVSRMRFGLGGKWTILSQCTMEGKEILYWFFIFFVVVLFCILRLLKPLIQKYTDSGSPLRNVDQSEASSPPCWRVELLCPILTWKEERVFNWNNTSCHIVWPGDAVAEVVQQRDRRESSFTAECFVVIILVA